MKKNLSFLKKSVLTLTLMMLFGISAFAGVTPGTVQKIWTVSTQQPQPGSIVTFGDVTQKMIYNGSKKAVAYTTDFPTRQGVEFLVIGTDSIAKGSIALVADSVLNQATGKYDYVYLNDTLGLKKQDLKPEVCWYVDETGVQSASTTTRYIYYDITNGYFMTTKDPASVNFFVQDKVAVPKADDAEYYRIGQNAPKAEVKISTATEGAVVNYRIGYKETPNAADYTWADWKVGTQISTISLDKAGDYCIRAYATKNQGQTDSVEFVKHVVYLDAPVYEPNSGITIDINGDAKVKVWAKTTEKPYNEKYTKAHTRYAIVTEKGDSLTYSGEKILELASDSIVNLVFNILCSDQYYNKPVDSLYNKTFYIAGMAYATENGVIDDLKPQTSKSDPYTIKPNVSDVDGLFGKIKAQPAEGSKVNVGDKIALTYELTNKNYHLVGNPHVIEITLKAGKNEYPVQVTWEQNDTVATFNVPAQLADGYTQGTVAFDVIVPAGMYSASSASNTASGNTYKNGATTVKYSAAFSPVTFTIDPFRRDIVADGTNSVTTEFDIYPSNGDGKELVDFLGDPQVVVTNSQNAQAGLDAVTVAKKTGTQNTFVVTFPADVVKAYFNDKSLYGGDYMVAFKEEALRATDADNNNSKNKNVVTGYIKFVEDVNFLMPDSIKGWQICEETKSVTLKVNGKGAQTNNKYAVTVAKDAYAVITGTSKLGKTVNTKAPIVALTDSTFAIKLDTCKLLQDDGISYKVTFAPKTFKASLSESKEAAVNLDVLAHINFTANADAYETDATKLTFTVTATPAVEGQTIERALSSIGKDAGVFNDMKAVTVNGKTYQAKSLGSGKYVIDMKEKLTAEQYAIAIPVKQFVCNLDTNAVIKDTVECKVYYHIDQTVYYICNNQHSVTYDVYAVKANGKNVEAGKIKYEALVKAVKDYTVGTAAAFNNGKESVYPEIKNATASEVTVNKVTYPSTKFTAEWPADPILEENNYQINFPIGTLYTGYSNANEERLFVNFRVANHIEMGDTTIYIAADSAKVDFSIKATDVIDNANAFRSVAIVDASKATLDGAAAEVVAKKDAEGKDIKGVFTVTMPKDYKTPGTYVLNFPAGSLKGKADSCLNEKDVKVIIKALDVIITINDTTVNVCNADDAAWCQDPSWRVHAYTVDDEGNKEEIYQEIYENEDHFNGTNVKAKGKTRVDEDTFYEVNTVFVESFERPVTKLVPDSGYYNVCVPDSSFYIEYKGLKFFNDSITQKTTVLEQFAFYDVYNLEGKDTTTTEYDVNTNATLNSYVRGNGWPKKLGQVVYKRGNKSTNIQAICVPFDIPAAAVKDQFDIIRFETAVEDGAATRFITSTLQEGDTAYANKPYIIKPKAATDIEVTLDSVRMYPTFNSPEYNSIGRSELFGSLKVFACTHNIFYMAGTDSVTTMTAKQLESTVNKGGVYRLSGGKVKLIEKAGLGVGAWRWLLSARIMDPRYSKIVIDGFDDDDATAIDEVETETIDENAQIYNIAGQKKSSISRGINIVNGKKVLKK